MFEKNVITTRKLGGAFYDTDCYNLKNGSRLLIKHKFLDAILFLKQ